MEVMTRIALLWEGDWNFPSKKCDAEEIKVFLGILSKKDSGVIVGLRY